MRRFTPEEDAELKRLWVSRIRDHELASRMGRYIGVLRCRAKKIGLPPSRRPLPAGELFEDLVELEDGHSALDRLSISRTEEGVPLAICERINLLAASLQTIARFPITDPKNMDAVNMQMIAEGAIALSRADERPFLDHGYCTCGRHRGNQCDQCLSLSRPERGGK